MAATPFDDDALARLKLAAEEMSFLDGRGYARDDVLALVTKRRTLSERELALLASSVCSEAQYRQRAVKEMLPEDIARRPLLVDGHDVVDAVTTALAGGILLESLDQTLKPLDGSGDPSRVDEALAKIGAALKEVRPSKTTWILDQRRSDAEALAAKLRAAQKPWRVPVAVEVVADPTSRLRGAANVASGDPAIVDASKSWCNLTLPAVLDVPGARRVKLQ